MIKIFFLIFFFSCSHSYKKKDAYATHPTTTDLEKIQKMFLEDYEALDKILVEGFIKGDRPVIRILGGEIFWWYQGQKKKFTFLSDDFVKLKMLSHIAVGMHIHHELSLRLGMTQGLIDRLTQRKIYLAQIQSELDAGKIFPETIENKDRKKRNRKLLELTMDFINQTLENDRFVDFTDYVSQISPLLQDNLKDAATIYIKGLHTHIQTIRSQMNENEWEKLRVIVSATRQHRAGEPSMLYFQKIFKQKPGEGTSTEKKVIYAEKVWNEQLSLQTLASHLIDRQIGLTIFNDEYRLQGDLLRTEANKLVNEILTP